MATLDPLRRRFPKSRAVRGAPGGLVVSKTRVQRSRWTVVPAFALFLAAGCAGMWLFGCGQGQRNEPAVKQEPVPPSPDPAKIKICYLGLTCEPAIFVAHEKGFFTDEGLDVELIKTDWGSMLDGL